MDNTVALFFAPLVALALFLLWRLLVSRLKRDDKDVEGLGKGPTAHDPYQDIEPLSDFDWSTTPPARIRPFKPKFHLTMGT